MLLHLVQEVMALDRLVPEMRDPSVSLLYDSTVDKIANPFIFVTYHTRE